MDVGVITPDMWQGIHRLLAFLWVLVPLAVIAGGSLLLSLAVIPSLATTGELPPQTERLRRPLYLVGLISGVGLVVALIIAVVSAGVIGEFWPRWSI